MIDQIAAIIGSGGTIARKNVLIKQQDRIEDCEDSEPEYKEAPEEEWAPDEYLDDDFVPDEEVKYEAGPTIGKHRAGKGRRNNTLHYQPGNANMCEKCAKDEGLIISAQDQTEIGIKKNP